jgi:hypothetical protein
MEEDGDLFKVRPGRNLQERSDLLDIQRGRFLFRMNGVPPFLLEKPRSGAVL